MSRRFVLIAVAAACSSLPFAPVNAIASAKSDAKACVKGSNKTPATKLGPADAKFVKKLTTCLVDRARARHGVEVHTNPTVDSIAKGALGEAVKNRWGAGGRSGDPVAYIQQYILDRLNAAGYCSNNDPVIDWYVDDTTDTAATPKAIAAEVNKHEKYTEFTNPFGQRSVATMKGRYFKGTTSGATAVFFLIAYCAS